MLGWTIKQNIPGSSPVLLGSDGRFYETEERIGAKLPPACGSCCICSRS